MTLEEFLSFPDDPAELAAPSGPSVPWSTLPQVSECREELVRREAKRLEERLSSVPFYAERAGRIGPEYWLKMAASYGGDE